MTTTVIVKTHSWPVLVESLDFQNNNPVGPWRHLAKVEAHSEYTGCIHSTRQMRLTELPQEVTETENSS